MAEESEVEPGGRAKMSMDEETRARYEEWKWKRIRQRLLLPVAGLLSGFILLMVFLISYRSEPVVEESEGEFTALVNAMRMMTTDELIEVAPVVYLFNAHPLEMIGSPGYDGNDVFLGEMSIGELTHVLANLLEDYGISTLVEEGNVDAKLHENGWEFPMSFYAARYFVLNAIEANPSLAFFIDLHRDGAPHRYATAEVEGERYAQVLFVIGTDNPEGYADNYAVASRLHEMLEERRPGISRGIFFSGGAGRDGIYSQDISPMMQLIEVGTATSTVEEVSRTIEVLAEVLAEYILSLQ